MNKKIVATSIFFTLMSLGQLLEGGILSFLFLLCCAALVAQLDKNLKSWLLNKLNKPELSLADINRSLSIKLVVGLFFMALLVSPSGGLDTGSRLIDESSSSARSDNHKWYEGGNLHTESALIWQAASSKNKLSTCADLIYAMKESGALNEDMINKLKTPNDYKPYAVTLKRELDLAFRKDIDPELNKTLFSNQEVHTTAHSIAALLNWLS
ncbi:hypothetical protein ACM9HF_20020 [Colwellia sp. RE-S-Sl-9]